jgi:hypothetical protein
MPGIGFIISAGITWLLASRLGLMPAKHPNDKDLSLGTPARPEPPYPGPSAGKFDAPFGSTERQ